MEQLTYGAFSADLHQRQAGQRSPMQVSIEVTRRCPLECQHCYNNLPMGDQDARQREMTTEEHFRVLDELVEMGCFWLLYTGGEIFARRDFLDIYTYAKKKGFIITLFTNGTLVTERIADHLVAWRPFAIEITLYGLTKDTYERLTGIPGSFDKCMRGIRVLLDRGLPLALKTVAVSTNRHEIPAMKRFVEEELGVQFKFDSMINPRIDCSFLSAAAQPARRRQAAALEGYDSCPKIGWKVALQPKKRKLRFLTQKGCVRNWVGRSRSTLRE